LSLITNRKVLDMHRSGEDVRQVFRKDDKIAITSKNPRTGATYLALFNISDDKSPAEVGIDLADLGLSKAKVTDMWSGRKLGRYNESFSAELAGHASGLYMLK
jgi:hypothetical protein